MLRNIIMIALALNPNKISPSEQSACAVFIALLIIVLTPLSSRGAVLLSDDFDSNSYSPEWTTYYGDGVDNAIFSASSGALMLKCFSFCGDARAAAGSTNWTDYTLEVDFQRVSGNDAAANVLLRVQEIGDGCDNGKYYQLMLKQDWLQMVEIDYSGGAAPQPSHWSVPLSSPLRLGEWHHLEIVLTGATAKVRIDRGQEYHFTGLTHYLFGKIGFKSINEGSASLWDNVIVTSAPPSVHLRKAVTPSMSKLQIGATYQLQVSNDLNTWTNFGSAFTATNTSMAYPRYWDVENWRELFFRLEESP